MENTRYIETNVVLFTIFLLNKKKSRRVSYVFILLL